MKTKERIVDALKRLGLQPDDDGDQVMFRYQMSNYVCFVDEDDECYMAFYIPCIYEVTEENEVVVLKAINECNLHMKTAKLVSSNGYVWAAYEVHVPEESGLEDFVGRAVGCLYQSAICFDQEIKNI